MNVPLGQAYLHIGQAYLHIGQAYLHIGQAYLHIGQAYLHIGDTHQFEQLFAFVVVLSSDAHQTFTELVDILSLTC